MNLLKMVPHHRARTVVMFGCGACLLIWFILITGFMYNSDPCRGKVYTAVLCDQFSKGIVSGSLCAKLCTNRRTVFLKHCAREEAGQTVFTWDDREIVVNSEHLQPQVLQQGPGTPYSKPEKGSSMAEFRRMIEGFLQTQLGPGDHKTIVTSVMERADANRDSKVSLAEAKTIWALLQDNRFLVSVLFTGSEHLPEVREFCGDTYSQERVLTRSLYNKREGTWLAWAFPSYYRWLIPKWHRRAKVMVGLLEYTLEALQPVGGAGALYLCATTEAGVGYNAKFEMKVTDTSHVLPKHVLKNRLQGRECRSETDCVLTPHCTTVCDVTTNTCTADIVRPNLHLVCQILKEYVLEDAPSPVYPEFVALLDRCDRLSYINNTRTDVEHSLVLNDLKSLLWKQIDNR